MRYGLGKAQNGPHGFDRFIDDHERASNAGKVEAQTRIMKDYINLTRQKSISVIVLPVHHTF